jgi:hypothetical protein
VIFSGEWSEATLSQEGGLGHAVAGRDNARPLL